MAAKEHSFDIASKVDLQVLKDNLNVCEKTIKGRYDLKDGTNTIELKEKEMELIFTASSEMCMNSLKEIFIQAGIKKNISIKAYDFGKPEAAFSGHIRMTVKVKQGIDKESAKKINDIVKESGLKVKTQIQDDQIRATSKDIDTLQSLIKLLGSKELDIPLQFINFR